MITIHQEPGHRVLCGSSLAGPSEPIADCLITDPPYSERTHSGHDRGVVNTAWGEGHKNPPADRRGIDYQAWNPGTVTLAAHYWVPLVRGWCVILSDHVLAPAWGEALESAGLYVFAPLPFVSRGSRIRLAGDGPSSWTTWITVARPRCKPYSNWGTLPGAYEAKPERMPVVGGKPERMPVVGGKPLGLMRQLVNDYSREGDTVWDPCCGGGTTLVAAKELGRKSVGMDLDRAHCEISAERLRKAQQLVMKFPARPAGEQGSLL